MILSSRSAFLFFCMGGEFSESLIDTSILSAGSRSPSLSNGVRTLSQPRHKVIGSSPEICDRRASRLTARGTQSTFFSRISKEVSDAEPPVIARNASRACGKLNGPRRGRGSHTVTSGRSVPRIVMMRVTVCTCMLQMCRRTFRAIGRISSLNQNDSALSNIIISGLLSACNLLTTDVRVSP
jgi:hypothetical protein